MSDLWHWSCLTASLTQLVYLSEGHSGHSWGQGVGRDTVQMFRSLRLESSPAFLVPGHHEQLVYRPVLQSGRLRPTPEQLENAFVNGAAIGLSLVHCQSIPRGMALWSLLIHLAGTTKAFTRAAADAWMPDVVQAIDRHREDDVDAFLQLVCIHLEISVRKMNCFATFIDILLTLY